MKKRILFYLILVLIGFKSFGQTTLLTEGWNGAGPSGWGIGLISGYVEIDDMTTGQFPTVTPIEGARLLEFESHTADSGTINLVSKTFPISTVGYTNITVDFEWYTDNGYPACTSEGVTVVYTVDNLSWISVGPLYPRYSSTSQWNLITQPLPPAASGQPTLYIGFWFTGQHGNDCHMDIMHLTGTPVSGLPTITTTPATSITGSSATLNGTANANGYPTVVEFEYGLTTSYGTTLTANQSPVTGSTNTNISVDLTGLSCGTTYHFRSKGTNSAGTTFGSDLTFTTTSSLPLASTNPSTSISSSGATLNGSGNAECDNSSVSFNWGLTSSYGNSTPGTPSTINGNSATSVSTTLTGLLPNQTYHYKFCATNSNGTGCGTDMSFTTQCPSAGPAGPITGQIQFCQGQCGYVYTVPPIPNATGYVWALPIGGTIIAGANTNTITVCYAGNAVSGNVSVYGTSVCGNGSTSQLAVTMNPPASPSVSGPVSVCVNSGGNIYTTQSGMSNYIWTISGGGIIITGGTTTDNTVTVTWNTIGAKTVCVNYNTIAGCTAPSPTCYIVNVNSLPTPTINGPNQVCMNTPCSVYTTQAGMTNYQWSVSAGGTITSGVGTNSICVLWNSPGSQNVSVNYTNANGCTATAPTVENVTINPLPVPTITGQNNICVNSGYYNYTTETGMTNYVWTVSSGGIINYGSGTNQIQVSWIISGPQTISVTYTTTAGCNPLIPTVLNVTVNPLPGVSGFITGNANVCAGANGVAYSVFPIPNTITYVWALPPNATIASGAGTNSITVNFAANASSGDIVVWGNNNCGDGQNSPPFSVSVTQLPVAAGNITGPDSVCQESTGKVYTVPLIYGASGYNWTLPQGATTGSGSNSNSIMVDFSNSAVSGDITVSGSNSCGSGTVSPNFFVTVNPIPPTPVVTNLGTTLQSNAPTGNQWFFEGTLITGATFQNYIATQNGFYWDIVTLHGCSSDTSNHKLILVTGVENHSSPAILVFPVPNDGWFNVSITTASEESFSIKIYNTLGGKVYEESKIDVHGYLKKVIDLRTLPDGVYPVVINNDHNEVVKKIVINK